PRVLRHDRGGRPDLLLVVSVRQPRVDTTRYLEGKGEIVDHSQMKHELPRGRALTSMAVSATVHCLTGCAIGEILGMVIATALNLSDVASIALSTLLAFVFGYGFTIGPVMRSGLAFGAALPIALAADTVSIGVMEIVDNGFILLVPGAISAGLADVLFWFSLLTGLVIAFVLTVPVNRWLIGRGRGHTVMMRAQSSA
ncbi:MAG: DUF4396 domain-containing protein, partial [Mycobacteriales bacterium]